MKFQKNISLCIAFLSIIGLPASLMLGTVPIFLSVILVIALLSIYHARALVKSLSYYDEIDKRINLIENSDSAKMIEQLDESSKELNLLKSKIDKYESERNKYESEIFSLKDEKEKLSNKLSSVESTIKTLEEKANALEFKNIEYKNKCLKYESEILSLKDEKEKLSNKLSSVESTIKTLEEKANALEFKNIEYKNKCLKIDNDNEKTELLIDEKNNKIKELETQLEDSKEKYSNLKEKYSNLKEEKRILSIDLKKESMKNTLKEFGQFATYESTAERMYKDEYDKNDFEIYTTDEIPCDGVVVHVDTTGLDCYKDAILKISALKFEDFSIIDSFESLINFNDTISSKSKSIHHIEESDVINAPRIELVLNDFIEFLGDNTIICHTDFDMRFINQALFENGFQELENEVLLTINLSKSLIPYLNSYSLDALAERFDLDYNFNCHNKVAKCFSLLLYLEELKNK